MALEKIPVSETLSDGTKVYNLNSNAADADFIRTWRLLRRIEKGDESARKELEALENEPMYYDTSITG